MGESDYGSTTGTIAQFKSKLGNNEFQNALNVSIQTTIDDEQSPVYTDNTTPTRLQVMNQLSEEIPNELTRVYVTGIYDSQSFYADYGVNVDEDEVEVEEETAPAIVKPLILFPK